jgi:hypothetical protein
MAEWLRSLTSNNLPFTAVGLNPYRDFGFFHVRKLSSKLYRTSVVLLICLFVPEIMYGRAPEDFLNH